MIRDPIRESKKLRTEPQLILTDTILNLTDNLDENYGITQKYLFRMYQIAQCKCHGDAYRLHRYCLLDIFQRNLFLQDELVGFHKCLIKKCLEQQPQSFTSKLLHLEWLIFNPAFNPSEQSCQQQFLKRFKKVVGKLNNYQNYPLVRQAKKLIEWVGKCSIDPAQKHKYGPEIARHFDRLFKLKY